MRMLEGELSLCEVMRHGSFVRRMWETPVEKPAQNANRLGIKSRLLIAWFVLYFTIRKDIKYP